jgi:hypothetical protein
MKCNLLAMGRDIVYMNGGGGVDMTGWALIAMPWRSVQPQTEDVTFRPTRYVHKIFCPLWQFSTVTLRRCDIFPQWHSDSVTIFYCNILTYSKVDGLFVHPKKKQFTQYDILTHGNFGQPMAVTFCPLRILIFSVGFLPLRRLYHKISGILRHCSMRFSSDHCRTVARDV